LSKRAVVDALKRGRSFVTRLPDGVEVYLTGTGGRRQRQIMGGTLYGAPTDTADFEILVRRAGGMRLTVIRDGAVALVVPITSDEQTVPFTTPIGAGGFVRVEVRGEPFFGGPGAPLSSRTDMEAFSNPVFLVQGPPPPARSRTPRRRRSRPVPAAADRLRPARQGVPRRARVHRLPRVPGRPPPAAASPRREARPCCRSPQRRPSAARSSCGCRSASCGCAPPPATPWPTATSASSAR
jgi:hypothetical protein